MNHYGFTTYASCQGHYFPVDRVKPYVAFMASSERAKRLACKVRSDAESPHPFLCWGWEVTASFNSQFELCYLLSPTNPHRRIFRYQRKAIDHDLRWMCELIKEARYKVRTD